MPTYLKLAQYNFNSTTLEPTPCTVLCEVIALSRFVRIPAGLEVRLYRLAETTLEASGKKQLSIE